jgi:hypothetical protein
MDIVWLWARPLNRRDPAVTMRAVRSCMDAPEVRQVDCPSSIGV